MRHRDQCRVARGCVKRGGMILPYADAANSSMSTCAFSALLIIQGKNEGDILRTTSLDYPQCRTNGANVSFQSCAHTPQRHRERRRSGPKIQSQTEGRCPWRSLRNPRWPVLLTQQPCVEESRGRVRRKRGAGSVMQR